MDEKTLALLGDYFSYHGILPVLLVIPFIVGLVFLFISGRRMRGLLTMICSFLYSYAFFRLVYGHITVKEITLFAAIVVPLGVVGWVKFHHFSAKKCFVTLIVFPLVIAGLLVVAPLIEKQEVLPFIRAITSVEWLYILFFACLGIWVMPYVLKIFLVLDFFGECGNTCSNQDGVNGATGDEDVTK